MIITFRFCLGNMDSPLSHLESFLVLDSTSRDLMDPLGDPTHPYVSNANISSNQDWKIDLFCLLMDMPISVMCMVFLLSMGVFYGVRWIYMLIPWFCSYSHECRDVKLTIVVVLVKETFLHLFFVFETWCASLTSTFSMDFTWWSGNILWALRLSVMLHVDGALCQMGFMSHLSGSHLLLRVCLWIWFFFMMDKILDLFVHCCIWVLAWLQVG